MKINFKLHKNKKPNDLAHFSYANLNPDRDWHVILAVFFIVNILGAVFSAYLFFTTSHHKVPEAIVPTINQNEIGISRLHKVVTEFDEKKEAYDKALSGKILEDKPQLENSTSTDSIQ